MAITVAGIVAILALMLAVPALRDAVSDAVSGNTGKVRADLRDHGAEGALLVLALAIVHTIVWYPAEILDAATGYVYDYWPALALVMTGWVISGILAYLIGRNAARPLLYRIVGEDRFTQLERMLERGGVTVLLAGRLVPIVPFSLMGYVAGAAHVPLPRYVWTTAVGYLPITAYFVYVGGSLEGFSASDPILWIGAAALLLALFGVRYLLPRATREGADEGAASER